MCSDRVLRRAFEPDVLVSDRSIRDVIVQIYQLAAPTVNVAETCLTHAHVLEIYCSPGQILGRQVIPRQAENT